MTGIGERLRSALIWAVALPVFTAGCVLVWSASFVLGGRVLERLIKTSCRVVLAACGIRIRVRGRENVAAGRPYIVMMNHVNFFDPLVLLAGFPGMARGVEEESHFRWPVYGATIRRLGVIPISRKDRARAITSLKRAAAWIRSRPDYSFVILPEGTRTLNNKLGPFKRGGFLLALETGLDILPIMQTGAFRIARKGSLLIRPGRIELSIEPAVSPAGYSRDTVADFAGRVRLAFLRRAED
ncbi:MAG: 1-acyl-sn-glycerol-3-phosphate acyltransferase [Candidatus Aminicenantes bacterium]|jgi:1-acyl-sn-glycerol-3-phosphate acyltransferase|nr:1-acyl-sn-glycerol-3-phosphate acyltransferase [Candidatus Aminicenantes bacterium]